MTTAMPAIPSEPGIGDVLAVRSSGLAGLAIRLGAAFEDKPNISNHIVVVHHKDEQGRWWGLQGQPGGVGWADLSTLLGEHHTLNNIGQPGRTDPDRAQVARQAEAMLGTQYDWEAIEDNVVRAFAPEAKRLWAHNWAGTTVAPGHVICSSYAAYLYEKIGWHHPECPDRDTSPGDWDQFVIDNGYNVEL